MVFHDDAQYLTVKRRVLTERKSLGVRVVSKGPQNRCPWTGERKAVIDCLEEPYIGPDGKFDREAFPGCDLTDIRSISAEAGFKDWKYFRDKAITNAGSFWHVHKHTFEVHRDDGSTKLATIYGTVSNSAAAGGELYRAFQTEQRRARVFTDVSSISSGNV